MILGGAEQAEEVFASLRAGACGFLLRDTEPDELAAGVRTVARGEAALSACIMRGLIAELVSQPDPDCPAQSSSTS